MTTVPVYRLRPGTERDTNLYIQQGDHPAKTDPQVGYITHPEVMAQILSAHTTPDPLPTFTLMLTLDTTGGTTPFDTLPDLAHALQGLPWEVVMMDASYEPPGGDVHVSAEILASPNTTTAQVAAAVSRRLGPVQASFLSVSPSTPHRPA